MEEAMDNKTPKPMTVEEHAKRAYYSIKLGGQRLAQVLHAQAVIAEAIHEAIQADRESTLKAIDAESYIGLCGDRIVQLEAVKKAIEREGGE